MSSQKTKFIVLLIICFVGSITSLFFPYLLKLNIHGGNLELPEVINGYSYQITSLLLLFEAVIILILITTKRIIWPSIIAFFCLGLVHFTRTLIHYQGFIDHDFDSKTGFGYHLLFVFTILFVAIVLIYSLLKKKP